jgi:hypothetical protein
MVRSQSLGRFLRADDCDIGHVTRDAALDLELIVDLYLGEELLNLNGKVSPVLLRVALLDTFPGPAVVLVEGEAEQNQEEGAYQQEGTP